MVAVIRRQAFFDGAADAKRLLTDYFAVFSRQRAVCMGELHLAYSLSSCLLALTQNHLEQWFYIGSHVVWLLYLPYVSLTPHYSKMKLGPEDAEPEFQ